MKKVGFCIVLILSCVACAVAQSPNASGYTVGSVTIAVPPPQGFENVIGTISNDHDRFSANPKEGLLAIQVRSAIVPQLRNMPLMPLEIYTRVVVSPEIADQTITPEFFGEVVTVTKSRFDSIYDKNGEVLASAKTNISEWASHVRGKTTVVNVAKPLNLGSFNESPDSFSILMLAEVEYNGVRVPMLISTSMLRLKERLVNASIYKRNPTESDITVLTEMTNTWTASILAANK
jgi:hypothetical protein